MSLTDKSALNAIEELTIKIRADKENNALHITDTGIGEIEGGVHVERVWRRHYYYYYYTFRYDKEGSGD